MEILPFGNTIDVVTVTGVQLRQIVELSASALIVEGESLLLYLQGQIT